MAKQAVISALEEVFGEYVLNFSKENLRIAALRGKIKLENVQLDGEVLGSMILGAVGLEGFGILSCSSESVKISVPWGNIEREPTKFEIKGVHLVCVPLMPSTAHRLYGGGTQTDPRCTLRTRAKRLALSRLERLFWTGQIPDEGPVMKKIQRAVREVERDQKRKKDGRKKKNSQSGASDSDDYNNNNLTPDDKDTEDTFESLLGTDDLPELPRDWKVKLREKLLRNLVASMEFVHIRCEVPEGGLAVLPKFMQPTSPQNTRGPAEDRAFAFGFTIEKFLVRTANEDWKVGRHDTKNPLDGSAMSSVKGHLGPNEYVVKNNKIGFFHKLSMYWDDEPPLLISETDILKGNYRKLSPEKLQIRIANAMNRMFYKQEPGADIRQSLGVPFNPTEDQLDLQKPHEYVTENFEAEVRVRTSDREIPGPVSCSADVLPFVWTLNIRHHQYIQYRQLQIAMKSQHRFDTMLRQRPKLSPAENPRAWWLYAVACVTSRPNSRPWSDVKVIVRNRSRYIDLVVKKNLKRVDRNGYHAGLTESESTELLALEELLPIEAMNAFHLIALRKAHLVRMNPDLVDEGKEKQRKSWAAIGRFRFSNTRRRSESSEDPSAMVPFNKAMNESVKAESSLSNLDVNQENKDRDLQQSDGSLSLLDAMTRRLANKVWFVDWRLHDATWNVILASPVDGSSIAHLVVRSSGNIRAFGKGKRDFCFDISQCDMMHHDETVLFVRPADSDALTEMDAVDDLSETLGSLVPKIPATSPNPPSKDGIPNLKYSSTFLDLPPEGVICRVAHGKHGPNRNYSIFCHPVNLIWKGTLLDELLEFFVRQAEEIKSDLAQYVRNAATPLARKAQLALISPGSFAIHLNVAAPKVWLPLKSNKGGVLLLDAGAVRVAGKKGEGESDLVWDVRGKSIHASYTKGRIFDAYMGFISPNFNDSLLRSETMVVSPFNFAVDASNQIETGKERSAEKALVRTIDIAVSPVCLNLVDAEVLARSFGKWYVRSIRRANRRASSNKPRKSAVATVVEREDDNRVSWHEINSIPIKLSVKIDKIEMALEGHSKSAADDDRSLTSLDSAYEGSPPIRAYLVEICEIDIYRMKQNQLATTSLTVRDASILRMKDGSQYIPLKPRLDAVDAQYRVLVRSASKCLAPEPGSALNSPIIRSVSPP